MTGFQLFWVNRDGCHMWDRKCSSGTPDFTPFGEFVILLIRYTCTLCITEFVSLRTKVNGLMNGWFAWISLAALSRDLFY